MNVEEAREKWLATLTPSDRIVFSQPVPTEAFDAAYKLAEREARSDELDLCTECGLPDRVRAEWGGSWLSHKAGRGHAFKSGRPRRFVFEYEPARDEWSVRETEYAEIVMARGFDAGFGAVAAWALEIEAFKRFGHTDKWERVEHEGDSLLFYGPAERMSAALEEAAGGDDYVCECGHPKNFPCGPAAAVPAEVGEGERGPYSLIPPERREKLTQDLKEIASRVHHGAPPAEGAKGGSGSRPHTARAYVLSLLHEWPRVRAWKRRHDQETGKRYSWWLALRATVENPPDFDRMWDERMEPAP